MEGDWIAAVDWAEASGVAGPVVTLTSQSPSLSDPVAFNRAAWGATVAGSLELSGGDPCTPEGLVELYRGGGWRSLSGLRGRFAALIWDVERREVIALRDPMGAHPLFVSRMGRMLLLSPSISRLVEAGAGAAVDRVVLAEHLWHRWPNPECTYFESVRRIPAGHALLATEADSSLRRYWDPGSEEDPGRRRGWPAAELDRFEGLFDQAIRRCSGSGNLGLFLSGGLDSVSIASRLVEWRDSTPVALCLAFEHPDCDESEIQAAVARSLGLERVVRTVSAGGAAGSLRRAAALAGSWPVPLMNVWNGEFYRLAQAAEGLGCDVILTGSGGDDWLGVSPYLAADLLLAGKFATLGRLVQNLRSSHGLTSSSAIRLILWTFGVRAIAGDALRRAVDRFSMSARPRNRPPKWLAPGEGLRRRLVENSTARAPIREAGRSFYDRQMRKGLDHQLIALELEESFEMGRRLGLRIAHPFMDPDLVEFLYRIPPAVLMGGGGPDRFLVRDRLAQRFPDLGFDRLAKSDARPFFATLARNEGARLWRELGGPRELDRLGIIDRPVLENEVERVLESSHSTGRLFGLWDLINVERWLRGRSAGRQA